MTTWQFYTRVDDAWEGMLAAIKDAKQSIDCEQYIFEDDSIGRRFLELFTIKAKQGVRVRLLVDAVGSRALYKSSYLPEVIAAGVAVAWFNPIQPWWIHKAADWFLRDHRKILVIDGQAGFTGGVGVRTAMSGRRDTHVRIAGPAVGQMAIAFEKMWQAASRGERIIRYRRPKPTDDGFVFLTNKPSLRNRYFYQELCRQIDAAQYSVYLTTPYYVPNRKLFRSMRRAIKRGVRVELIVPEQTDHPFVDVASQSYFWLALMEGVRIWLHQDHKQGPNLFIHAKTFAIDNGWASVGSTNLDNLSLLLNYESDLVSTDPAFVQTVRQHFERDKAGSIELTRQDWKKRRTLGRKLSELATWPFHRVM